MPTRRTLQGMLGGWLGAGLLLAACGSTSGTRYSRTVAHVSERNAQQERRALSRYLRGAEATLLEASSEWIEDPAYSYSMSTRRLGNGHVCLNWPPVDLGMDFQRLRDALRTKGWVEVRLQEDEWMLLLRDDASEGRGEQRYYARARDGRLFVIKTVLVPVEKKQVLYPGNCDGTPTGYGPRVAVIVVKGARGADVGTPVALQEVTLPYEGTALSSRCASYTE